VRIGIDVGGTKIEGLLLGDDGREIARLRVATPIEYGAVLAAIAELVQGLAGRGSRLSGPAPTIGVGTPGFLQPGRGLIRNANLLCLNDRPLDKDLELALGRPVRLANDAKCFVLS
jgi:fructokinase